MNKLLTLNPPQNKKRSRVIRLDASECGMRNVQRKKPFSCVYRKEKSILTDSANSIHFSFIKGMFSTPIL